MEHLYDSIRNNFDTLFNKKDMEGASGVHESMFRSYQILEHVKTMIERGDSIETIKEFIEFCEND